MNRNSLGRASILVMLLCVGTIVNLHGCSKYYIESTERNWLGSGGVAGAVTDAAGDNDGVPKDFTGTTMLSGRLQSSVISELSGLAVSSREKDVFWAINDSGNAPILHAVTSRGKDLASLPLPVTNIDWEDMASFKAMGKQWLMIADTGDNLRRRKTHVLYLFEEPSLDQNEIKVHRKTVFTYEDGPQNVESIAVSASDNLIYLIAKNSRSPKIYALPLQLLADDSSTTAKPVARIVGQLQPLEFTEEDFFVERLLGGRFLLPPTAMDISADDTMAVVANYRHAYLYRKSPGQSWLQAFNRKPQVVASHRLAQSESIAFDLTGNHILIGSEGTFAPLLLLSERRKSSTL